MKEANTYFRRQLIHSMLRAENDPADAARARAVLIWAAERTTGIVKTLSLDETRLFDLIWRYWSENKEAPSRQILGEMALNQDKSDGMTSWLEVYDDQMKGKVPSDYISAATHYANCVEDTERMALYGYLHQANHMLDSSVPVSDKKDAPLLKGPRDARMFLVQKLQSDVFTRDRGTTGGSIANTADSLADIYENNEQMAKDQKLVIPTGIHQLDDVISGMCRRSFNLILGAAGQRKSALARTIAYNTAVRRQRVLFIPLEMSTEEELSIFGVMHARNARYFDGTEDLTVQRFEKGLLTKAESEFLKSAIIPDMKKNLGDNLIITTLEDTTWPGLRNMIEMTNFLTPLDLVVIDYFANMNTTKAKDKTAYINEAAYEAKQFVLHDLNNDRGGAALLSPAHPSRKGVADAKQNDGNWDREAVYMYSELEKAADLIMTTYMDMGMQNMEGESFIKLGTCKSRRSADVPAQLVPIDHGTHVIGGQKRTGNNGNEIAVQNEVKNKDLAGLYS